jgi:hypothetical protein
MNKIRRVGESRFCVGSENLWPMQMVGPRCRAAWRRNAALLPVPITSNRGCFTFLFSKRARFVYVAGQNLNFG